VAAGDIVRRGHRPIHPSLAPDLPQQQDHLQRREPEPLQTGASAVRFIASAVPQVALAPRRRRTSGDAPDDDTVTPPPGASAYDGRMIGGRTMNPMPAAVARAFAVALACAAALVPDEGIAQVSFDCVTPATPSLVAPVVLGNGSAGSVTTAQVQQALDAGGPIRLDVGVSTLVLGTTLRVTRATTLDLGGATLSGGHVRRVIEVQNPANQTYAFTLSHGSIADGSTPTASGAGLYKATGGPWQAVTLRFFDVRFTGNHAIASAQDDGGGALYVVGAAEVAVVRGQFDGNSGSNGGAFYSLGSKRVNLYDSVFTGNHATGSGGNPGNGGNGGAIGVDGDARFLNLCRIRLIDNEANAFGGGLFTVTYSNASHTRLQTPPCRATRAARRTSSPAARISRVARSRSAAARSATTTRTATPASRYSATAGCSRAASATRRSSVTSHAAASGVRWRSRRRAR